MPLKQAQNVVTIVQTLGLQQQYHGLMEAATKYENNIQKAKAGMSRNEEEMQALPDDIERASMRGQPQQEAELTHALETTRPKEHQMYAKWAKRLSKKLEQEASATLQTLPIQDLVPKNRAITEGDMKQIIKRVEKKED